MSRHIQLLGSLSITDDNHPSVLQRNAKGCALLTYLLVRGQTESREHLADLLWDAADTTSSLRNLRVLLTRIHQTLPGLQVTRTTLRYQHQPQETIDYFTLFHSLTRRDAPPSLDELRLYRGELLEGFSLSDAPRFMEWITVERERLRRLVLDAYAGLCRSLATENHWRDGEAAAAAWMAIDQLDEEALRWRMQFLAASGQLTAIRDVYQSFRRTLWDELGVDPDETTRALIQTIEQRSTNAPSMEFPEPTQFASLESGELPSPGPLPAHSVLPYWRNEQFVGRTADLLRIAEALAGTARGGQTPVVAITGIGGLGKTQTAVEFCFRYGRYFPGGVFWLNFAVSRERAGGSRRCWIGTRTGAVQ